MNITLKTLNQSAVFFNEINKNTGYGEIRFNVIKNYFGALRKPIMHLFNLSLQTRVFPDSLKILEVTPLLKTGDPENVGNYGPMSIFLFFNSFEAGYVQPHL